MKYKYIYICIYPSMLTTNNGLLWRISCCWGVSPYRQYMKDYKYCFVCIMMIMIVLCNRPHDDLYHISNSYNVITGIVSSFIFCCFTDIVKFII